MITSAISSANNWSIVVPLALCEEIITVLLTFVKMPIGEPFEKWTHSGGGAREGARRRALEHNGKSIVRCVIGKKSNRPRIYELFFGANFGCTGLTCNRKPADV